MQGWRAGGSFLPARLPVSPSARAARAFETTIDIFCISTEMEDAHTALLKLDEDSGNAFFAVFDGHTGAPLIICAKLVTVNLIILSTGSSVAKFAAQHVAKRLVSEQAYREFKYEQALKNAFLGTDEDLRAGMS